MTASNNTRDTLAALLGLKARVVASAEARAVFDEALAIRREIAEEEPDNEGYRTELIALLRTGAELFPFDAAAFLTEAAALETSS